MKKLVVSITLGLGIAALLPGGCDLFAGVTSPVEVSMK